MQLQCAFFSAPLARSSHSHIKRKPPQILFLQYNCFLTMINIVKKYLRRKIHELNTLIGSFDDSQPQAQNKYIVTNRLLQKSYQGSFRSFVKFCSVFSGINHVPPYFFYLKFFLWKCPLTVKVRKKIIDQILGCISFYFEIRAHFSYNLLK